MNHIQIAEDFQTQLNVLPMRPGHIGKHGGRPNMGISYLAEKNDCSLRYVSDHLAILEVPELHKDIAAGKIPYTFIRAYLATPTHCRTAIIAKFMTREFQTREAAMAVASALKHYPNKSAELLAMSYKSLRTAEKVKAAMVKIINPPMDTKAAQETVEKFMLGKKVLENFMDANHPDGVFALMPNLNAPLEMINLNKGILAWGKSSSAKSLPKLAARILKDAEHQQQLPLKSGQ